MPRLLAASISIRSRVVPSRIETHEGHASQGSPSWRFVQLSALARIRASEVLPVPRGPTTRIACETRPVRTVAGLVVLAGQACYTAAEWAGQSTPLEGRSAAPDIDAYDRSIRRLRDLGSAQVRFGHDRTTWTA